MKVSSDQRFELAKGVTKAIFDGFYKGIKKVGLGDGTLNENFLISSTDVLEVSIRHSNQILEELGIEEK